MEHSPDWTLLAATTARTRLVTSIISCFFVVGSSMVAVWNIIRLPDTRRSATARRGRARGQRLHLAGAVLEALVHSLEGHHEGGEIAQEAAAGDPRQRPEHEAGRSGEEAESDPSRLEHRTEDDAHRVVVEHAENAVGSVEEVERVAGRWRVQHNHVEAAAGIELVYLLHRHVLEAAGHGRGERLVDLVAEDVLRLPGLAGIAADGLGPGPRQ